MKFSYQWLTALVSTGWDLEQTCAKLNDLGLEVEETTSVASDFNGVVIGKVLTVAPHPNADKLRVTTVDVGRDAPVQIVCGAPNVRVGMLAPTALVGAVLPGITIQDAELRGVASSGMLCSAGELGIDGQESGLWDLPAECVVGADLRDALNLNDASIEISLTPNRADALSVVGVARDLAALSGVAVQLPGVTESLAVLSTQVDVRVDAALACPSYLACCVKLPEGLVTPLWMKERLRRSGLRSLGLVVDVTNYVMLELGQPMHAFDADKIQGAIQIRNANPNESLTLLDGKSVCLAEDMLVIADDTGAIALAGIMGGQSTAVTDTTRHVVLECAHFTPAAVVGRARRLGLHTDASHRFERGVDPLLPPLAMKRALNLLVEVGAQCGAVVTVGGASITENRLSLRRERIERLLGMSVADAQVVQLLSGLSMKVTANAIGWDVVAPSWRFDMTIEADLVEELARMIGLDNLPKLPLPATSVMPSGRNQQEMRLKQLLVGRGYQEAITYSFVDGKEQRLVEPEQVGIDLANPIAETLGQMRVSLWTGLLSATRYNLNRQAKRVRFFETGLRFLAQQDANGLPVQIPTLAGIACGSAAAMQWGQATRHVDFYDVKGDVEALLASAGLLGQVSFESAQHPALHPGQTASIYLNGQTIGLMGSLHPSLAKQMDIDVPAVLFSIDLAYLTALPAKATFQGLSKFPLVRRDIAVVVDASVTFAQVSSVIASVKRDWFQLAELFDVYAGKGLSEGQRSLAIALWFQDVERTLTDTEIETCMNEIIGQLSLQLNAQLRA
ncbi:MAG: phenylalanine--tRNA ligase subunit beta [Gammaproteobacteria bacterium]|nr:phenylalanine--tRNA ligase subunit beta [Gammaproteobacteria bacterium]